MSNLTQDFDDELFAFFARNEARPDCLEELKTWRTLHGSGYVAEADRARLACIENHMATYWLHVWRKPIAAEAAGS